MADVINRTTKQYLVSVNTPDYSEESWIINPDLSGVLAVPRKYWKIAGDTVVEMTSEEKAAYDATVSIPLLENYKVENYTDGELSKIEWYQDKNGDTYENKAREDTYTYLEDTGDLKEIVSNWIDSNNNVYKTITTKFYTDGNSIIKEELEG